MKKILIILILPLAFLLCGCFGNNENDGDISYNDTRQFQFKVASMGGEYNYEIVKVDDDNYTVTMKTMGPPGYKEETKNIDRNKIKELEDILKKYEISKWNGFDRDIKDLMDGLGFRLYYKCGDKEITARGYGVFPDGYKDFSKELYPYFDTIFEE